RLLERIIRIRNGAQHPVAVRAQLRMVGLDQPREGVLVTAPRGFDEVALIDHRFGSHNATCPASGLETTLRQPDGPSRGSSNTVAPSLRARSVDAWIWSTST